MIVDRYDPINLFELVPKLELEMDPELAQLDHLLEDDVLFKRESEPISVQALPKFRKARASLHAGRGDPEDAGGQEALWMELRANRTLRLRLDRLEAIL